MGRPTNDFTHSRWVCTACNRGIESVNFGGSFRGRPAQIPKFRGYFDPKWGLSLSIRGHPSSLRLSSTRHYIGPALVPRMLQGSSFRRAFVQSMHPLRPTERNWISDPSR